MVNMGMVHLHRYRPIGLVEYDDNWHLNWLQPMLRSLFPFLINSTRQRYACRSGQWCMHRYLPVVCRKFGLVCHRFHRTAIQQHLLLQEGHKWLWYESHYDFVDAFFDCRTNIAILATAAAIWEQSFFARCELPYTQLFSTLISRWGWQGFAEMPWMNSASSIIHYAKKGA